MRLSGSHTHAVRRKEAIANPGQMHIHGKHDRNTQHTLVSPTHLRTSLRVGPV